MIILRVFCILIFFALLLLLCSFLFLLFNKSKLLNVLDTIGLGNYAKILAKTYIPIRGTAYSDQKDLKMAWGFIKKVETNNSFLRIIQFILKFIDCIKIFILLVIGTVIIAGCIYLIYISNF